MISVTIPAYKTAFLREAIASVCAQIYDDWELIIVDDASPEDIKSVVDQFKDKRIRYYRNEKNCGAVDVVDNWNICLNYCRGEYVICMGDDDMLPQEALMEYSRLMTKYPGLNVYHALTEVVNERGEVIARQRQRPEFQTAEELILHRWSGDIQFIGDFCYSVSHLKEMGGYYKLPLAWASDDITAVRAAEATGIANTQKACFLYRENVQSITSSRNNGLKLEAKACERRWYLNFFQRHSDAPEALFPRAFDDWFRGQIELHLIQFFEESLCNLLPALAKSRDLGWSKGRILSRWWRVVRSRMKNH